MKVADLLKHKQDSIFTITNDNSLFEAMTKLLTEKIGALIVVNAQNKLVGIISERDLLRGVYQDYDDFKNKSVASLMSSNPLVAILDDEIDYIMKIMTKNQIRHMPVVDKEKIVGMISIRDVIKFQLQETEVKNRYLEEYLFNQ